MPLLPRRSLYLFRRASWFWPLWSLFWVAYSVVCAITTGPPWRSAFIAEAAVALACGLFFLIAGNRYRKRERWERASANSCTCNRCVRDLAGRMHASGYPLLARALTDEMPACALCNTHSCPHAWDHRKRCAR